jgi:hypothetical protein
MICLDYCWSSVLTAGTTTGTTTTAAWSTTGWAVSRNVASLPALVTFGALHSAIDRAVT